MFHIPFQSTSLGDKQFQEFSRVVIECCCDRHVWFYSIHECLLLVEAKYTNILCNN